MRFIAIIRGAIGKSGLDIRFEDNYREFGLNRFDRMHYTLPKPEWGVLEQVNHHLTIHRRHPWELPIAGDFELPLVRDYWNIPPAWRDQSGRVREYLFRLRDALGYAPVVYSGKPWWERYVGLRDWTKEFPLWLAAYYNPPATIHPPERFFPGDLPAGWAHLSFPSFGWQFSSTLPGAAWGVQSAGLDMSWVKL